LSSGPFSAVSESIVNDFSFNGDGTPHTEETSDAIAPRVPRLKAAAQRGRMGASTREHSGVVPVLSARSLLESESRAPRGGSVARRAAQYEWGLLPLADRVGRAHSSCRANAA